MRLSSARVSLFFILFLTGGWSGGEVIVMLAQLGWDSELGKNTQLSSVEIS